jgi:hypothetical protein
MSLSAKKLLLFFITSQQQFLASYFSEVSLKSLDISQGKKTAVSD